MAKRVEVIDFMAPELDVYARLSESALVHYYEPQKEGLFIAESFKVIERAIDAGYEPVSFLVEQEKSDQEWEALFERFLDVTVYEAKKEVLEQLQGFHLTSGILAAMKRKKHPDFRELIKDAKRIVVLENVMNPTNVGAIFRSAAAMDMDAVLLTGGCSDPLYRRSARVSMGNVFLIPWTYMTEEATDWSEQQGILKEMGFATVAMALREDAVAIDDERLMSEEKLAIIMGTEGEGLMEDTIDHSDYTVIIPMANGVDSLNVAAASAVAFWQLRKR